MYCDVMFVNGRYLCQQESLSSAKVSARQQCVYECH